MCRILGYLGATVSLDRLILKPEHSLLTQSYKPQEMKSAILNGDGFGFGWYDEASKTIPPFIYRNPLPMWNDRNLDDLCRYVRTPSLLVNVRSATDKMPAEMSNCQPFAYKQMLFVHNGWIENFYASLYRPIREQLGDIAYRSIKGQTDSEHIFALLVHYIETQPKIDFAEALRLTVQTIADMANKVGVHASMNIILSTGDRLIAIRYDNQETPPSLYLLKPIQKSSEQFPASVIIASEPLFQDNWQPYEPSTVITVDANLNIATHSTVA